ncbi:hypothetical protein ACJJIL_05710 [Microbulbifer sp. EKSA005]|uniref:hypothetical protein n=1 Tax=Microbulbifer sp. EKSA005 TaxID=3243364 RepID=UPI00404196AF
MKVEYIFDGKPVGIFIRILNDVKFELGDYPNLAGCLIKRLVTQSRILKEGSSPDLSICCLCFENGNQKSKFNAGVVVAFVP